MTLVASFGLLEWIFLGLLGFLAAAVGLFALFLIVNQFRNPGRAPRSRP